MHRRSALALAALIVSTLAAAPATRPVLQLGTPFTDHMVVQRGKPVPVWGTASPNAAVTVTFGPNTRAATADSAGRWTATLPSLPVGGPYALHVAAGPDTADVRDVLSGDVYLCAGQSNMQFAVGEDVRAADLLAAELPNVRLLQMPRAGSPEPKAFVDARWSPATPAAARHFSDVAFQLARNQSQDPTMAGVPIGVIDSSFGGTAIEGWLPADEFAAAAVPKEQVSGSMLNLPPTQLYNGMIAPLGPTPLAAVVWYQGESNAGHPAAYGPLLTRLIAGWRRQFAAPELPVIVVQLPAFTGIDYAGVREAEAKVVAADAHAGLVVTYDCCDEFNLHPRDKGEVARRVDLFVRRLVLHEEVVAAGPTFKSAVVDGPAVRVTFAVGFPLANRRSTTGFALAGADGVYHFAAATVVGPDAVVVGSPDVPDPKTVRYAWGAAPAANLADAAGLPAAPFRTDDAPLERAIELLPLPPERHVRAAAYEATIAGDGTVASLVVRGQQLLSNDPGGGCKFPAMFAFRSLGSVTPLTAASARYSDGGVSVTYTAAADAMAWQIDNPGNGPVPFRVHLAAGVKAEQSAPAGPVTLRRGNVAVTVTGIDRLGDDGRTLEVDVPKQSARTIVVTPAKG